jgi:hypothetical protein
MTKAKTEDECRIGPFWKVRIGLPGMAVHLASRTEPDVVMHDGKVVDVRMGLITIPSMGTRWVSPTGPQSRQ